MTQPLILCLNCGQSGYAKPPQVHRCTKRAHKCVCCKQWPVRHNGDTCGDCTSACTWRTCKMR